MPDALIRLAGRLKSRKIDALLITQPDNRRYLSGFKAGDLAITESSGALLVLANGTSCLFTDSRYQLEAEAEAPGFQVEIYRRGLLKLLEQKLRVLSVKKFAFESHYTLHTTAGKLADLAEKLKIELVPLIGLVEDLRIVKTADEIDLIRQAVRLNEAVFQELFSTLSPGMTERQVAVRIETMMRERGADCPSFPTIVAAGPNAALPHAVPTDRPILEGEPLVIDMGLKLAGYCSDMTRTVVLGKPDAVTVERSRVVRRAQLAALAGLKAGVTGHAVDRLARQEIQKAGLGHCFGHGLGHGVGLAVHEAPALNPRYAKKLRAGMVVTVEPGVYLPGWGGIRLENMVVVRPDGYEDLNRDTTFLDL
ncbi:MAG: peptidase M24 [Deltaproteobacteria bacterium RIFOXYD12_FULL_50_9]|nr:MAG: peptidase M24 [Deltaproteobacteria bacterium RIFOXYD12_FULL_50_9]